GDCHQHRRRTRRRAPEAPGRRAAPARRRANMIAAVVLGAGESRRMGRPKLLLPYGEMTIVERIVQQLAESGVGEFLVVLGHEPEPLRRLLAPHGVRTVLNSDHTRGMLSSVRAGVRALPPDAEAFMVCLGDQPTLCAETVDALIG